MANFERKQVPFLHQGMNWNSPVEKLQDGQVCWAKNIRVLQKSTVNPGHGMTTLFTDIPANYIHSFSRLNVINMQTNADGTQAFDPALGRTYVMGADKDLYVFQKQDDLTNPALNPVSTIHPGRIHQFSGNPLSVIDAQPAGAAVAWKYIGDSVQMCAVGYYPGDQAETQMARCLPIGLPVPVNTNKPTIIPGGNLLGLYQWAFAYRNTQTGARSNPSAATRMSTKNPGATLTSDGTPTGTSQPFHITIQVPDVPYDPQTPAGQALQRDSHIVVDIYRFGGVVLRWALVGSMAGGTVFTDNVPDINLLAAPSPPQTTDASTGLTRNNLYQPFVTQDIARKGSGTLSQQGTINIPGDTPNTNRAIWTLSVTNHAFNMNWIPGSTVYVNGIACSIYQVWANSIIELAEDLNGQLAAGPVNWSTNAGTLMSGQPLPHIWGPYGVGQSGSYIFACGDPNARGTLYWTNGNDPDSTDIVNNIIVTSPSEKLVTGAVYDGQPYCWSTERQFQIFPSLTVFGQFTTQEVAGAKGVWLEWSLSVQSNGVTDQSVTWRGKDGIYDWSSQGLQCLSDPLYAFFPHDNNPGEAPETIFPFLGPFSHHPEHVGNLDDTMPKYHRLCWFQGLLYYDFVAQAPAAGLPLSEAVPTFSTLVWDTVNLQPAGWVSLDQPFQIGGKPTSLYPVARAIDIGANDPNFDAQIQINPQNPNLGGVYGPMARGGSLKVLWGGPATNPDGSIHSGATVYDYYGLVREFECRFITRAEDIGDSRGQKRWGDYWLDCVPLDDFVVYPLAGFHRCVLKPVTVPRDPNATGAWITPVITPDFCSNPVEPGTRAQFILDFVEFANADGASLMSPTLGLDIIWTPADGQYVSTLNQWSPSYVIKPEVISFRASDPDDMGALQAKYFTGLNLEANTFGQNYQLNVILDNQVIDTLNINHNGQSEHPYAFNPKAGYLMQLQMEAPQGSAPPTWQLYKVNWIFEPWPDSTSRDSFFTDAGYVGSKFMQGMIIPMETGGKQVTFNVQGDCGINAKMGPVSTPSLCKMDLAFSFSPCNTYPSNPFIASQIQVQPDTDARFWYDQIRWIWEPEPELVATWVTQPTDFDLPGWHSQRDCYIAYRGGHGAPTLYVTTEYGTESYKLDPVSSGQYTRCYRVLKPQKAKWRSFRVESCGLFRLYLKDCEVKVKAWGTTGPYISAQPFGDLSRTNGGARI